MKLSIVIVSYNTRSLLRNCLLSVMENAPSYEYEIFVVDNGSRDGSPDMVREAFKDVVLLENCENVGFAAANNQALRLAQGEYVLLLNSDTFVPTGAFDALCHFADAHRDAAVVASQLVWPDGRPQPSSGAFPNLFTVFVRFFGLKRLVPAVWRRSVYERLAPMLGQTIGGYLANYAKSQKPRRVDRVGGACMLVRSAAIAQVGYLDENYFMYVEDIDWCRRFHTAGWQIYYLPSVQVVHLVGQSSSDTEIMSLRVRSLLYYFRKHHGRGTVLLVQLVVSLSLTGSTLSALISRKRTLRLSASSWRSALQDIWTINGAGRR